MDRLRYSLTQMLNPALLIAAGSGVAMAFQGTVNAAAAKVVGLAEITFVVLASGAAAAGVGMAFGLGHSGLLGRIPGEGGLGLAQIIRVPWWALLGGPVSPLITVAVAYGIQSAGAVNATTAIIVGQIGMAGIIDHMGWLGAERAAFTPFKLVGLVLVAVGAYILLN
ncbi:MAG: DMT family transporter [Clostridia bacterium]|nr:DMT family transporter [Clostridia bacterium]